jgi:hypothetical protein
MWFNSLKISDFRSIKQFQSSVSPNINLLVGRNNSGKSSFIDAVATFGNLRIGSKSETRVGTSGAQVFGWIASSIPDYAQRIAAQGTNLVYANNSVCLVNQDGPNPQTLDSFSQNRLWHNSDFVLIPSERRSTAISQNVNASAADSVIASWSYLPAIVDWALSQPDEFRNEYRHRVRDICGVDPYTYPASEGKLCGTLLSESRLPFTDLGGGVPHIFGIVAFLMRARNKIVLIEEVENELNPDAIRKLCSLIRENSSSNQFFISTHSNIVVRELGGEGNKVFHCELDSTPEIPVCNIKEVTTQAESMALLLDLGYDASDMMLYKGFLILEEASAEQMVKSVLIPLFVPNLQGKLKTVSAGGVDNLEASFYSLNSLFVFVHLQEIYKEKAWVLADGDAPGIAAVETFKKKFAHPEKPDHLRWPESAFKCLAKENFEDYLPQNLKAQFFSADGTKLPWKVRKEFWVSVFETILADQAHYGPILAQTCAELIEELRTIEAKLV